MIGIIMQIFYQLLTVLAMTGILNGGVPQKDSDAYTPSAVIDYVETGMEQKVTS